jgi:hypothetical protein
VALGTVAALDYLRDRNAGRSMQLRIVAYSAACFAVYLLLRRLVPGNDHQVHAAGVIESLRTVRFSRAMLFESFLNQNTVLLAIGAAIAARRARGDWRVPAGHRWLPILMGTWAWLAFLALCAGLDVDIGRIAAITVPLFAASAGADLMYADAQRDMASPTGFEPVLPPGKGGVLGH